ncbi:hypothetical protein IL306_013522 [Fusarium sp. DS 682]|nr:hypothetical protein IL306_013522 [Fusarium sp. DS 682]
MSGFEVAGIVLGSIPLVISALEAYSKFMRDWGKATSELRSLHRQLSTEQIKLRNVCQLLISDVVPQQDIEQMLANPFGPLWIVKETNDKIRKRLWDAYGPFEDTVAEIRETLENIMERLRVHISDDGQVSPCVTFVDGCDTDAFQVEWVSKGRITRDFKKMLYRINRDDYKEALTSISKGISDLEALNRLSIHLEPSRKKQSRGKLFKILRDLSASIYRALSSSILCSDSHDVSLELTPRLIEIGHEAEDEKIWQNVQFRVAISFEIVDGPATKRFWDEVNIKTATSLSTTATSTITPPEPQTKGIKRVSFRIKETLALIGSTESSHDMKSAMAMFSRPATDIAFIKTCHEETKIIPQPLNLCTALKTARKTRPVCYGHLVDKECTERHYQVYPIGTAYNSDESSIVSLDDILRGDKGFRPLVLLTERVQLALAIASNVLQLSKTPWLPEDLTRTNIQFFKRNKGLSYEYPFLLRTIPGGSRVCLKGNASARRPICNTLTNPTLFALGILLLEIILGSSFEQLQSSEKPIEGVYDESIRDLIAAHKLLEQRVAFISPVYKAVVQRCIDCTESKGLDDDGFRQKVCNDVIMQLEAILDATKLVI